MVGDWGLVGCKIPACAGMTVVSCNGFRGPTYRLGGRNDGKKRGIEGGWYWIPPVRRIGSSRGMTECCRGMTMTAAMTQKAAR